MPQHDEPALFIMRALQAADRAFFANVFNDQRLTKAQKYIARKLLREPTWRPLCELAMNGVTSFEGALILSASGLIERSSFTVRAGHARGLSVNAIELSGEGSMRFQEYYLISGNEELSDFSSDLVNCFTDYAAIDYGAGLVAARSAVEGALHFDDWELLSKLREIPDGKPVFISPPEYEYCIDRDEYLGYSSDWVIGRSGCEIIDLSQSNEKYAKGN